MSKLTETMAMTPGIKANSHKTPITMYMVPTTELEEKREAPRTKPLGDLKTHTHTHTHKHNITFSFERVVKTMHFQMQEQLTTTGHFPCISLQWLTKITPSRTHSIKALHCKTLEKL